MRRALGGRAIAFTFASVGLRNVSRSVSTTQLLASRKVGVGMSCSMSGSWDAKTIRNAWDSLRVIPLREYAQEKGEAVFPPPLGAFSSSPVQQDPADSVCPRSIRPPPPSEPPIRKCDHWLLRGIRHDLRSWRTEYGRCPCRH